MLAYRYVGTLCCCSLMAEALVNFTRYLRLSASHPLPATKTPGQYLKSFLTIRQSGSPDLSSRST